ncbi:hypothetical protein KSP40_PGU005874 [Platanthera guangdongensis]|uniref:Uncharacterized protein n=1 Tax=Platanthera guangdongensis TaxID=2320717 RepID=A0ABR2MEX7_9ASPA
MECVYEYVSLTATLSPATSSSPTMAFSWARVILASISSFHRLLGTRFTRYMDHLEKNLSLRPLVVDCTNSASVIPTTYRQLYHFTSIPGTFLISMI